MSSDSALRSAYLPTHLANEIIRHVLHKRDRPQERPRRLRALRLAPDVVLHILLALEMRDVRPISVTIRPSIHRSIHNMLDPRLQGRLDHLLALLLLRRGAALAHRRRHDESAPDIVGLVEDFLGLVEGAFDHADVGLLLQLFGGIRVRVAGHGVDVEGVLGGDERVHQSTALFARRTCYDQAGWRSVRGGQRVGAFGFGGHGYVCTETPDGYMGLLEVGYLRVCVPAGMTEYC